MLPVVADLNSWQRIAFCLLYLKKLILNWFALRIFERNKFFAQQYLLTFLLLVLVLDNSNGQNSKIYIKDAVTKEPVPFASVRINIDKQLKPLEVITDTIGGFNLPDSRKYFVLVSAIGYKPFSDSISAQNKIIFLFNDIIDIERVVVTGQVKPKLADKSIYKIDVIDRKNFELKAATSLGDALKGEPGFQYRSEGIFGDFLRIQGLTGEHLKILIDGIPVAGRIGGVIDLNQLNLNNIDHIEIVEGPMSVIYGSDAMAGVINLITRIPSGDNLFASVESYYETVGRYNFAGNVSKNFKNQSVSAYLLRNFNDGWSPEKNLRFKYYKPKLQYGGGASYNYQTENIQLRIMSDFLYEELRDPDSVHLSVISDNLTDSTYFSYLATDYYHYSLRLNSRANLRYSINRNTMLSAQIGHSYHKKRKEAYYKNLVDLEQTFSPNSDLSDTTQYQLLLGRIMLQSEPNKKMEILTGTEINQEQSDGNRTGGYREILDFAAFSTFIYTPVKIASIQPGVRYIYNSAFKAPLVYSVNAFINPYNFQVRASYGKSFRSPSLKELYMEFVDVNHHVFGNPDLESETGNSFNLSLNYTLRLNNSVVKPELMTFYNSIENAIQLAIDPERPGWGYYFNIPSANYITKGYRLGLKATLRNFSFTTSIATTGKSTLTQSKEFCYSTDYVCNAGYSNFSKNFTININYKYTNDYLDYAGTFDENYNLTGVLEQRFSNYQLMDLVINKYLFNNSFVLSTGIKNIFDVSSVDTQGTLNIHGGGDNFVMAGYGRTFFIKLYYKFRNNEE